MMYSTVIVRGNFVAQVFKPHAWPSRAPGFLKLHWFTRRYACVCVCVCVSAPEAINNQWRDMV